MSGEVGHGAPGLPGRFAEMLRWGGLIGIVAIAVMRCLVIFAPQVVFDVDPAMPDAAALLGLGPAGSLALDVLLLLVCLGAVLGEWLSGRRLDWLLLVLALIPLPVVLWHGLSDAGNLWRGSTWAAAAVACAVTAQLARDRTMRIVLIALLLAAVMPLLVRGVFQITVEHAGNVRFYEEHKDAILRDKGWPPDSSAVRLYERRLRQPQPLGWFATSNIYASLVGFGLIVWIGLALAAMRAKMQSGWSGAMAMGAIAAAIMLWMTGSKGAILAVAAGLGLMVVLTLACHNGWNSDRAISQSKIQNPKSKIPHWFPGVASITLVVLVLLAVAVRGTLLPESFAGDKSLLYRWHYMIGSVRILAEHSWLGVGPDGYQAAYVLHRMPRSPEEVASAHSMFWDWLCTLGRSGAAWIVMVFVLLGRSGRGMMTSQGAAAVVSERAALRVAIAVAALAMLPAIVIEWPALDGVGLVARVLGIAGFIAVACMAASIAAHDEMGGSGGGWILNVAVIAAVAALLMHAQIEMTFQQPGAVVWAMCALGIAGSSGSSASGGVRRGGAALPAAALAAVLLAAATWLAARGAIPAARQQWAMMQAAELLAPRRPTRADDALALRQRQAAADALVRAYQLWPADIQPLEAAALQLELASVQAADHQAIALLSRAKEILDQALREHGGQSSTMSLAISVEELLARRTGEPAHWSAAIDLAQAMAANDPHGLSAWRRLGDLLWNAGRSAEAAAAYRRALECDANFALDPDKQLSQPQRIRLRQRVDAAAGGP